MIRATVFSASPLLEIAEGARDQIATEVSDLAPGQRQAWVAVVFATAAVEAFLNDLTEHVEFASEQDNDPELALLVKVLKTLESRKSSAELKIEFLHLTMTGVPIDRGQRLQQEFVGLASLRNQIVHARPDSSLGWNFDGTEFADEHKLLKQLRSWGLVGSVQGVFTEIAATRATARWACQVAKERVSSLKPLLARGIYSKYFDPVFNGFMDK